MVIEGHFYVYFELNLHFYGQLVVLVFYVFIVRHFFSCYSTNNSIFSKINNGKLFAIASNGEKEHWKSDSYKL